MGTTTEMDLVYKNTFIEFVPRRPNLRLTRSRSNTDTALVVDACSDREISHELPAWESPREFCKQHHSACDSNSESSTADYESSTAAPSMSEALDVLPNFSDTDVVATLYDDSAAQAAMDEHCWQEAPLDACCSPVMMPTYEYPAVDSACLPDNFFYMSGFEQGGYEPAWCLPEGVGMAPCTMLMADGTSMQMHSIEGMSDMYMNPEDQHAEAKLAEQEHLGKLLANAFHAGEDEDSRTTVMLRNLPNSYSRGMLLELLNEQGFAGRYDFVYLPVDFSTSIGLGYAFVNLLTPSDAVNLMAHFDGFSRWLTASDKVCTVSWSYPHQGLEQHIERYRNSPVMHSSIPEEWKPILLVGDLEVPFPHPTKQIKAPKLRIRPETAPATRAAGGIAVRV